jgi:hypothetical protein
MIEAPIRSANPPPSSTPQLPKSAIGGGSGGIGMAGTAGSAAGIISLGSRLASGQPLPQAAAGAAATGVGAGIGTAAGAAIGTALLPGAGTAIGGAIGGALGGAIGSALADALMPGSTENQKANPTSWEQVAYWESPGGKKVNITWYDTTTNKNLFPPNVAGNCLAYSIEANPFTRDVLKRPYPEFLRIRFLQDFGSGPTWSHRPEDGMGIDPSTVQVPGEIPPPAKRGDDARNLAAPLSGALPTSPPAPPPATDPRNPGNPQNFPKPQPRGTPHPSSQPNLGGNLPNNVGAVPLKITPFEQVLPGGSNTSGNLLNPGGSVTTGAPTGSTMPAPIAPNVAGVKPSQAPQPVGGLTATPPAAETKTTSDPRIDEILKQLEAITPQLALLPLLFAAQAEKPNPLSAADTQKAAAAGACDSAAPSGCLGKPLGEIKDEASGASQAAKSADKKLDEVNAALNLLDLGLLKQINGKVDGIHNKLGAQIPNGGISGLLQKSSRLLSKTWSFLQVDRVLNVLTFITSLHNAYMLSSSLTQTLFSAIANVLDVFGLEDEDGNALDISSMVNKWTQSFFERVFGASAVAGIKAEWTKLNRIYQAASNVIWSVQSIFDSMRSLTEIAIENTGKIGNALRKAGAVFENAYGTMTEKATARNLWQKKIDNFAEGISGIENVVSNVDSAASEALSIQDTVKELKDQQKEFKDSVAAFKDDADSKEAASKTASVAPQL